MTKEAVGKEHKTVADCQVLPRRILRFANFCKHSWFFEKIQGHCSDQHGTPWLRIKDGYAFERMHNILERLGVGETRSQQQFRIILYLLGALFAVIYLVRYLRTRQAVSTPWLKLRSRSPDPEKSDARKSAEKQTKAVRPFGSESTRHVMPVYHS